MLLVSVGIDSHQDGRAASAEAKRLIASIEADTLVGLRDRALIATIVYSFARVSAALAVDVDDLVRPPRLSRLRHSKMHEMQVHHRLLERFSRLEVYAMERHQASRQPGREDGQALFPRTGITTFLLKGGTLELARDIVNSPAPARPSCTISVATRLPGRC